MPTRSIEFAVTKDEAISLIQAILLEVDCHAYLEYWNPREGTVVVLEDVSKKIHPDNAARILFGRNPINVKACDLRLDSARLGLTYLDLPTFQNGGLLTCWCAVRTHFWDEDQNDVRHPDATRLFGEVRNVIMKCVTRSQLVWCDEQRKSRVFYSEGVKRWLEEGGTVILGNNRITKLCLP